MPFPEPPELMTNLLWKSLGRQYSAIDSRASKPRPARVRMHAFDALEQRIGRQDCRQRVEIAHQVMFASVLTRILDAGALAEGKAHVSARHVVLAGQVVEVG